MIHFISLSKFAINDKLPMGSIQLFGGSPVFAQPRVVPLNKSLHLFAARLSILLEQLRELFANQRRLFFENFLFGFGPVTHLLLAFFNLSFHGLAKALDEFFFVFRLLFFAKSRKHL